jgi:hypothetical protein
MKAPEGGECGGITASIGNSLREESSFDETISCAIVNDAVLGRLGATTTAGKGALVLQQLVRAVLPGVDAGAQQLCAALCVRCRQVPNGASRLPINRMAIAARWKLPFSMALAYHSIRLQR